jgi:hypothetical protein
MTQSAPPEEKHPIAHFFRKLGISQVAIIDDGYDVPTVESLNAGEIGDFWATIEREQEMLDELEKLLGRKVSKPEDIDDDVVRELWLGKGELKTLSDPCAKKLFATKLQMRADLDALSGYLRMLGLDPIEVGAENDLPDPSIKLVFLDYILNPRATDNPGQLAISKAVQMYERVKEDEGKPFIILISLRRSVEQEKEKFRHDCKILGGMFGFIAKEDIKNKEKLYLKLISFGIGDRNHLAIQRFVDALVESLTLVVEEFKEKIRTLDIQDYSFVQLLSLHEEGQPLGDYILWLFEATLGYMFRNSELVRREQRNLDKLEFEEGLRWQTQPSTRLAEVYRYALTEPAVEELGPHPLDKKGRMPLLALGDIFIKNETNSLLMVINATCDLAFAPTGSRKCDPEQPIFLVPGVLEALDEGRTGEEVVRTELFEYDSKSYRIKWDYKHVYSQKYRNIWGYFKKQGYSRISRLRLPYALEVQQKFVSNVARIGVPISPPLFAKANMELLWYNNEDKKLHLVGDPISDGVVIIHGVQGDRFIPTVDCISVLLDKIATIISSLEKQKSEVNLEEDHGADKVRKMEKIIGKLKQWTEAHHWLQMLKGHSSLPKGGKMQELEPGTMGIYLNQNLMANHKTKILVALNIKWDKDGIFKEET